MRKIKISHDALRDPLILFAMLTLLLAPCCAPSLAAQTPPSTPPLRALFVTGGVFHDYDQLAPFLTTALSQIININFTVLTDFDALQNQHFADGYDVIVYDLCLDDAKAAALNNAITVGRLGKPTVFIHCAVHSFRNTPQVREWENYVGLRSKFHDTFGPFATHKVDPVSPITKNFPADWKTTGDELYQTIERIPGSTPLLTAKSPVDGRVHVVCWTHTYGLSRVFATTLGHDAATANSPAYIRLLASGLLWTVDKLRSDGQPAAGYAVTK